MKNFISKTGQFMVKKSWQVMSEKIGEEKKVDWEKELYQPVVVKIPDEKIRIPEKVHWSKKEILALPGHVHGGGFSRVIDTPSVILHSHIEEMKAKTTTTIHRHSECLIYIISGKGQSEIQGKKIEWEAGSLIYIPPWAWHRHWNPGPDSVWFLAICPSRLLIKLLGFDITEDRGDKVYSEVKQL